MRTTEMSLTPFLVSARAQIHNGRSARRMVRFSRLANTSQSGCLHDLMADKAPLFYRSPDQISDLLEAGFFRTAFREALSQLPTSQHFRQSHFSEILSAIFAQSVMGWQLIYSKLKLLTAENSNPYKMDLVFFDRNQKTPTFILGEVKSSMKCQVPANHHKSCYPSLFNSLRDYSDSDMQYDLTAARDNISGLSPPERERVRTALLPYSEPKILFAGFTVIDTVTRNDDETKILATRKSPKKFDIELLCVDELASVCESTYSILDEMRRV